MAILKIARMGHPVLRQRAHVVKDPTAPAIRQFVADMIETMHDADGRGLAAPQVHVPLRIAVFVTPEDPDMPQDEVTAIVNPEWELLSDERVEGWEGCLSVPGLTGPVPRCPQVRYRGVTPAGDIIDRTVTGMHAVVVQHEFDHLDGILYPQRMSDISKLIFDSEARWYQVANAEEHEDL